ncbi:hypothetical protein OCF84_20660 (plasmid) [Shewanella xiamenensis]|uniref:Uncharacterized protein n=1 Tax=Shewanella xiamenensis TaxID=332186 RepID=A0ABT6UFR5_9GAMM|nr:hypothetical protein [Shewanella xiamenensis]MDI5833318.1 hypothetical protein [Shewanella xiamenensis]WHF57930.1 hypothetical protein OCF84_20660 [Shewanella xiamenensis]
MIQGELSKSIIKKAILISNPELTAVLNGDSLAPMDQAIDWIAPFQSAMSNAIASFTGLPKCFPCEIVAASDDRFELLFDESEGELDQAVAMHIVYEVTQQMIGYGSIKDNTLDITNLLKQFTPKNFGLEAGEILNLKVLEQSLLINALSQTDVFTAENAFELAINDTSELDVLKPGS